jgi:hypothetical protein
MSDICCDQASGWFMVRPEMTIGLTSTFLIVEVGGQGCSGAWDQPPRIRNTTGE